MMTRARVISPARVFLALAALALAGCETTTYHTRAALPAEPAKRRIVLLPADVELSLLHAGGSKEVNAQWTRLARRNLSVDLTARFRKIHATLVERRATAADFGDDPKEIQLLKLYEALGVSILLHQRKSAWQLPTKAGKFDWSLGPEARYLKRKYGADYALFVYIRDSYASSGRVVAMILRAPFGGMSGGRQLGFSSLVDIETGEVVWFNFLQRSYGDLRTPDGARETMDALLADFPK